MLEKFLEEVEEKLDNQEFVAYNGDGDDICVLELSDVLEGIKEVLRNYKIYKI